MAEGALSSTFLAILEAERAGANVSGLMAKLDEAGRLLVEAEIAYRNGNFNEADRKAGNSFLITDNARSEALNLKELALADAQRVFWLNLLFS